MAGVVFKNTHSDRLEKERSVMLSVWVTNCDEWQVVPAKTTSYLAQFGPATELSLLNNRLVDENKADMKMKDQTSFIGKSFDIVSRLSETWLVVKLNLKRCKSTSNES